MREREFLDIDIDRFDAVLEKMAPRLALTVPGPAPLDVHLHFHTLDDFSPERVAAQVPALAELLDRRRVLNRLHAAVVTCERFADLLEEVISAPGKTALTETFVVRALLSGVTISEEQLRQALPVFFSECESRRVRSPPPIPRHFKCADARIGPRALGWGQRHLPQRAISTAGSRLARTPSSRQPYRKRRPAKDAHP